jgi:hypothetical protein
MKPGLLQRRIARGEEEACRWTTCRVDMNGTKSAYDSVMGRGNLMNISYDALYDVIVELVVTAVIFYLWWLY